MSCQYAGQSGWRWSPQLQQWYWHDQQKNQYLLPDGRRVDVPRLVAQETNQTQQDYAFQPPTKLYSNSWSQQPSSPATYPGHASYGSYTAGCHQRHPSLSSSGGESSNEPLMASLQGLQLGVNNTPLGARSVSFGRITEIIDPNTNVRNSIQTEPKVEITDPALFEKGIVARRMLRPTPEDEEVLDKRYKVRDKPSRFFKTGRVFYTLWAEPAGGTDQSGVSIPTMISGTMIGSGRYNEPVHQKVRRFVVVRENALFCTALPIGTYGGQGVAKERVKKSDHAIIYSGKTPPSPTNDEKPGRNEEGMRPTAIRVVPDERVDKLDPMSRIDFGKPHTVHHNVKVRPFGMVEKESQRHLVNQFMTVMQDGLSAKPRIRIARKGPAGSDSKSNALRHTAVPIGTTVRDYGRSLDSTMGLSRDMPRHQGRDAGNDSSGDSDDSSDSDADDDDE